MKHALKFLSALSFAVACLCSAAQTFVVSAKNLAVAAATWLETVTLDAFKLAAAKDDGKAASVVMFAQSKAFVLRIIKRERPVISADWRMCPSV